MDVKIKQRISEAITTLTDELDLQMSKLELSLTQPLTDDQKILSEPLFHTDDTVVDTEELPPVARPELTHNDSVLTISSSNTSVHGEDQAPGVAVEQEDIEEEEAVIILDDDDEDEDQHEMKDPPIDDPSAFEESTEDLSVNPPSKSSEPNCSAPFEQGSLLTSSVMRRLSDFFNKIPDYEEPEPPSEADATIPETPPESPGSVNKTSSDVQEVLDTTQEDSVIENSQEDMFNREQTPSPVRFPPPPAVADTETAKKRKQKATQEINIISQVGGEEVLKFAAKIKVDIVIRTQEATSSDESPSEGEEDDDAVPVANVKQEKGDLVVVKEEKRTPVEVEQDSDYEEEFYDPESSAGADKNERSRKTKEDPFNGDGMELARRRTSMEIAQMDTQSNSPPALTAMVSGLRESFTPFRETPKGQKPRISEKLAMMDTILNSDSELIGGNGMVVRNATDTDTQCNSPPALNATVSGLRESFTPFRDTPKGQMQRVSEKLATMDTILNSTSQLTPMNLMVTNDTSVMDTQPNSPPRVSESFTPFKDTPKGQRQRLSAKIAQMDTVVDTLPAYNSKDLAEMDTQVGDEAEASPEKENNIVLDEQSIAILHSIYGENWRTPQLMRSMKRTDWDSNFTNDSSFQPNMTDFQKCKLMIRNHRVPLSFICFIFRFQSTRTFERI